MTTRLPFFDIRLDVEMTSWMRFSPDGSTVLALDEEDRLRTHLVAPDKIKAALCRNFGPLSAADWKTYVPGLQYRRTC
jgi:hypothetical protein